MTDDNNAVVVRSRQADTPTAVPTQIHGVSGQLPEVLQLCNAIAAAGDLIPRAYQGKPGAVLLAKMWADKHDIDLFTAVQQIYPIQGKPYVSAEMRVALATAKGFEFRVVHSDRESCTIEVWGPSATPNHSVSSERVKERGMVTVHIDDVPETLRKKDNWKNHPDDMLFADACRKADRRYVKTAAAMLDSGQDYAPDPDPLDIIAAVESDQDEPDPADAVDWDELRGGPGDVTEEPAADEPTAVTEKQLRSAGKVGELLRAAKDLGGEVALVRDIVKDQELARAVLDKVVGR